jgi:hypothetical protein
MVSNASLQLILPSSRYDYIASKAFETKRAEEIGLRKWPGRMAPTSSAYSGYWIALVVGGIAYAPKR